MPFVAISPDSRAFLRELSSRLNLAPGEPATLIEIGPSGLAYWNCYEYARRHGGRIVFGWQVLAWPGIYLELLHHAVVEDADGNLIDPTICTAAHNGQAVFIEDRQAALSRRNPPPIASMIHVYRGEAAAIGEAVQEAKQRHFEAKRHLARIIEESGVVSKPVLADYPWPRSPEIAAMLDELNKASVAIDDLHTRCMAWDVKHASRYAPALTVPLCGVIANTPPCR
ncbi:hypothetical protein DMC47_41240 [Nostoc sp. 3335mG]|nr:hypothetical protein DMC47_41240 [Nostoc sp. 3335mG]